MAVLRVTQVVALLALLFASAVFARRWRAINQRPLAVDRAPAKGSPQAGVRYAFTLGMLPWAKESTRRHAAAYLRGVAFHLGIFAGLGALALSPFLGRLPEWLAGLLAAMTGLGAVCGLLGATARWLEPGLRALSTPDDHAAVLVVTAWLGATSLALTWPAWLPVPYLTGAVMLVYSPLGKIRHCLYFVFSRRFFGLFVGRRGVLHAEVKP